MKKNIGKTDKIIRALSALVLVILYITGITTGLFGIILIALAVVFIITGFINICPLYLPFGLSTIRKKLS